MTACVMEQSEMQVTFDTIGPPPGLEDMRFGPAAPLKISVFGSLADYDEIVREQEFIKLQAERMQQTHVLQQLYCARVMQLQAQAAQHHFQASLPFARPWAAPMATGVVARPPGVFHCTPSDGGISQVDISPRSSNYEANSSGSEVEPTVASASPAAKTVVRNNVTVENIVREDMGTKGRHGVRASWTVDANKLTGNDTHAISPSFELTPGLTGKLMLQPKANGTKKGQAAFKKAKGRGSIEFKCEAGSSANLPAMTFFQYIGSGDRQQTKRGPVTHTFDHGCVCGLPKDKDDWNFNVAVDRTSQTFSVHVEVFPHMPEN